MASLLQTDAAGLNAQAEHYQEIYPIAARCGVFAKTDIQPLINEGATTADLAASIFQAVVNQTISGLACGKPIRGCVAFLGGPLHFLPELKKAFIRTLKLTPETTVDPENSHLFAAMGAALQAPEAIAILNKQDLPCVIDPSELPFSYVIPVSCSASRKSQKAQRKFTGTRRTENRMQIPCSFMAAPPSFCLTLLL